MPFKFKSNNLTPHETRPRETDTDSVSLTSHLCGAQADERTSREARTRSGINRDRAQWLGKELFKRKKIKNNNLTN